MSVLPKYQVFISSTFSDLRKERERVTWEVLKSRHIPVGMENFGAASDRGWPTITRVLDGTDYYVLILAGRYGTVDPDTGISWTEREYNYAVDTGIPVLAFVRNKSSITVDKVDGQEAQAVFVDKIRKAHLTDDWSSGAGLANKVVSALQKKIEDDTQDGTTRPGWFRGAAPSHSTGDAQRQQDLEELRRVFGCLPDQVMTPHFNTAAHGWFHADVEYFADKLTVLAEGASFIFYDSELEQRIRIFTNAWFDMLSCRHLHSEGMRTSFNRNVRRDEDYDSYMSERDVWDQEVGNAHRAYRELVEFTKREYPEVLMRELETQAIQNRTVVMAGPEIVHPVQDSTEGIVLDDSQLKIMCVIGNETDGLTQNAIQGRSDLTKIEIRIRLKQLVDMKLIRLDEMEDMNGSYEAFVVTDEGLKWVEQNLDRAIEVASRPSETDF